MAAVPPVVLYEKQPRIYPRSIKGRFRNIKTMMLVLMYAGYLLLPYLRWQRGVGIPDQAVLFDIPHRVFYLFGLTVWPQEVLWLVFLLIFSAALLFFVTGLAGRAFCGYLCPQTLWTDLYYQIEHWLEGERPVRMRLDEGVWGPRKLLIKASKHAIWIAIAVLLGFTFVAYFTDSIRLWQTYFTLDAAFPAYVTSLILGANIYVMGGFMREQLCINICPYGRFQSAMFDENTLIVAYDKRRGELSAGRFKPDKEVSHAARQQAGHGDCIDCGLCVQVCPTGVDIRNGMQYQCISCALCIDACDTVMDKLNWPRGLISYTSENALDNKPVNRWGTKTVAYGLVLAVMLGFLVYSMLHQTRVQVDVRQERQPMYVEMSDGRIQNKYTIKLTNKLGHAAHYTVSLSGLPPQAELYSVQKTLDIPPGKMRMMNVFVRVSPTLLKDEKTEFAFRFRDTEDAIDNQHETSFYVPEHRLKEDRL